MRFALQCVMLVPIVAAFHGMQPYRHRFPSSALQDVAKRNAGKNPNLLKEELGELTVGIKEFQTDAFQQLYNKSLSWSTFSSFGKKAQVPLSNVVAITATTDNSAESSPTKPDTPTTNSTADSQQQLAQASTPLQNPSGFTKANIKAVPVTAAPAESVVYKAQPGVIVNEIAQPTTEIEFARLNSIPIVPTVEPKAKSVAKSASKPSAEPLFNSVFDMFKSIDLSALTKKDQAESDKKSASATKSPTPGGMFSFLNPSPGFDKRSGDVKPAPNKLKEALFSAPPAVPKPAQIAPSIKAAPRPEPAVASAVVASVAVDDDYRPPVVKVMKPAESKATAAPPKSNAAGDGLTAMFGFLKPKSAAPPPTPARSRSPVQDVTTPAAATMPPRPVVPVRTVPPPAATAPAPRPQQVAPKAPVGSNQSKSQGGGIMGMYGSTLNRSAPEKTVSPAKVAPVQNRVAPTTATANKPVPPVRAPPASKGSITSKPAPTTNPASSFFSFLKAPPSASSAGQKIAASAPAPAVPRIAPPAPIQAKAPPSPPVKPFTLFPKPQTGSKVAAVPPPAKAAPVVQPQPRAPPAPSPVTKGLLNLGLPSFGAVKSTVSSAQQAVTAPASGMSEQFRATVSRLLKGDAAKINAVQKSTDSFRAGSLTVQAYVSKLTQLFGDDLPDSITKPLVTEIPEKDLGKKLSAEFARVQAARQVQNKTSNEGKKSTSPFSFSLFGGSGSKDAVTKNSGGSLAAGTSAARPVVPVTAPPRAKPVTTSVPAPKQVVAPAPPSVKAQASPRSSGSGLQVPEQVPIAKKAFVEAQLKSVMSGGADVRSFYSAMERELGRTKLRVILPALMAQLPRDKATQLQAVDTAMK